LFLSCLAVMVSRLHVYLSNSWRRDVCVVGVQFSFKRVVACLARSSCPRTDGCTCYDLIRSQCLTPCPPRCTCTLYDFIHFLKRFAKCFQHWLIY
jgi:hypothetical protein